VPEDSYLRGPVCADVPAFHRRAERRQGVRPRRVWIDGVREVEVDAATHGDTALELLAHSFRGEVRSVDGDARLGLNESVGLRVRLTPCSHDAFAVTAGVDVGSVDDLCALG
jgi:hypothetical protein